MSWIEEHIGDMETELIIEKSEIEEKLDIDKLYKYFEDNYIFLVADILRKYKEGYMLSPKQKNCLYNYVLFNDLESDEIFKEQ